MQFRLLTLITHLRKFISERWRPSCRTHVRSLSSKFSITFTNISCGTVAFSFCNGKFQIVDCTRFSNVDFWFEVTPKKEIAGRYYPFKKVRSFCATLYKASPLISIVNPTRCTNSSNLFYFGITLYMFQTVFPSIIRSWRLYIQQQVYASKQTAVPAWHVPVAVCTSWNPDDGRKDRLKHVECYSKIK
jgi:hypothetical protein